MNRVIVRWPGGLTGVCEWEGDRVVVVVGGEGGTADRDDAWEVVTLLRDALAEAGVRWVDDGLWERVLTRACPAPEMRGRHAVVWEAVVSGGGDVLGFLLSRSGGYDASGGSGDAQQVERGRERGAS